MMQELPTKDMELKDSPIGAIPKEWDVHKLPDVCTNHDSKRVPIKESDRASMKGKYPYYGASGVIDYVNDYIFEGEYILLGEDGENVLSRNLPLAFIARGKYWVNNHAHVLKPKTGMDIGFLCEYLESLDYKYIASGSAQPKITQNSINRIKVPVPPEPEQQQIASILTSVDEVIEKTEAQISKLQDLKTGMMQELLTKGIGHTEFKDSPVGRIPKVWDAVLLDSVSIRGSGHTPSKSYPEYWNGGIRWVSLSDSNKLDRLYISESAKEISQTGLDNSSAVLHPRGTVILSRDAGVGKSAIIGREMAVSQHFIAWRCGEQLDNHYLYYLLQYWKPRFEGIAMGSTIQTIGLPYFKKLVIPLPPIEEQKTISKVFLSADKRIFEIENKLHQIKSLKKALMQDLLTGKVRVNVK